MNLIDIIANMGIPMKMASRSRGGEWHGPCPCDPDSRDRFHVWPEQGECGTWWCRSCGEGGDAIRFLMRHQSMSFANACRLLGLEEKISASHTKPKKWRPLPTPQVFTAHEYGFTPEMRSHGVHVRQPAVWQAHAAKFQAWCHHGLMRSQDALDILQYRRGIMPDVAARFGLGWNAVQTYRPYASWGMSDPHAANRDGHVTPKFVLPAGIVIPWWQNEAVCRLRIRRMDSSGPKYHVVSGSSSSTFFVRAPDTTGVYVVVETELDAILIAGHASDVVGAVALGSLEAKPDGYATELLRQASKILVALDFDEAGAGLLKPAAHRAVAWWLRTFHNAVWWPVPYGKDPGDAWWCGLNIKDWILAGM